MVECDGVDWFCEVYVCVVEECVVGYGCGVVVEVEVLFEFE